MDATSRRAGWFATRVRSLRNGKVLKCKEWEAAAQLSHSGFPSIALLRECQEQKWNICI